MVVVGAEEGEATVVSEDRVVDAVEVEVVGIIVVVEGGVEVVHALGRRGRAASASAETGGGGEGEAGGE